MSDHDEMLGRQWRRQMADPESLFGIGKRRAMNVYGVDLSADLVDDLAVYEAFAPAVEVLGRGEPGDNWAVVGPAFDDLLAGVYLKYRGQKITRRAG